MNRGLLLVVLGFAGSTLAVSAPCTTGSLASYISLGATGCTIGGNTLFDFNAVPGTAGATEVGTGSVSLIPAGSSANPGLTINLGVRASANSLLETIFTYQISGESYTSDSVTIASSSETGDGAVTDVQNYCEGGTFSPDGVTGCTGTPGSLLALDGVQNTNSAPISATLLGVTDDFTADGGTIGSAMAGTATDQFTAVSTSVVPEPSSLCFVGFAALAGAFVRRRAVTRNVSRR